MTKFTFMSFSFLFPERDLYDPFLILIILSWINLLTFPYFLYLISKLFFSFNDVLWLGQFYFSASHTLMWSMIIYNIIKEKQEILFLPESKPFYSLDRTWKVLDFICNSSGPSSLSTPSVSSIIDIISGLIFLLFVKVFFYSFHFLLIYALIVLWGFLLLLFEDFFFFSIFVV